MTFLLYLRSSITILSRIKMLDMRSRRNTILFPIASTLLVSLVGACGGTNVVLTPPTPLENIKPTVQIQEEWNVSVGSSDAYYFSPAVVENTVYVAVSHGKLAAYNLVNGSRVWEIDADKNGLSTGVGADVDTVVVVSRQGRLLAFDKLGQTKWQTALSSEGISPPVLAEGLVLVRTNDNRITAYSTATGQRQWVYQRQSLPLMLYQNQALTVVSGLVLAGFPGGKLVAIGLSSGSLRWESNVGTPKGTTEIDRIADVVGTPAVKGGSVCSATFQGRIACFALNSGQLEWARELGSGHSLTIQGSQIIVLEQPSRLVGLSLATGGTLWKQEFLLHRQLSSPIAVDGNLFVGDYAGYLHVISVENGNLLGRKVTDGRSITAPPQWIMRDKQGYLLVQSTGGYLGLHRIIPIRS